MKTVRFKPTIVGFLCNWCSYAAADKAGGAQVPYPPNVRMIRVMCSGRVDPQFVLEAFHKGADGVMILACHPGDCHYKEGNYRAVQRHTLLRKLLAQHGIEPERCRFDYVSAGEDEKFVRVVTEMVDTVRDLGPLAVSGQSGIGRAPAATSLSPQTAADHSGGTGTVAP
jgi:F420-non-reducing hydrogenase iron-sulfur subunit